jgi:hypothetical protein
MEIDVSQIKQEPSTVKQAWKPPRHVFFGKKNEDGSMEDEPVYAYQAYPCMLYRPMDDKLAAILVHDDAEKAARIAEGYADSPAKFGIVTAPSFEQNNAPLEPEVKPLPFTAPKGKDKDKAQL